MPDENNHVDPDNINYTTNTYGSNNEETGVENNTNDDLEEINEPPVELKEEFVKPKKKYSSKNINWNCWCFNFTFNYWRNTLFYRFFCA